MPPWPPMVLLCLDPENSLEKIKRQLPSGLRQNLLQNPLTFFLINYKWLLYIRLLKLLLILELLDFQ
ncbi:hypothetical protein RchiOBHm_Chr1g0345651 [Rosa chinensis]|uniref:Uncharacterized protein n=1 Tax=Rosa chinensis TaxID=74649 RepID=A0A2P6SET7_ROSCH|nr:hypothetical protein RchiOBHm_Chr1g0345651 [Rosa chinensis]